MNRTTARQAGFTLLEVLVALAVVALALLGALRASGSLQDNAMRYREAVLAEQCAENFLVEQYLQRNFLAVGQTRSRCTQAGLDFLLDATVAPTPNPNFRRLDLTVRDPSGWGAWHVAAVLWNP